MARKRARERDEGGANLFFVSKTKGGCHAIVRGRGTRRGEKQRDSTREKEGFVGDYSVE